MTRRPVFEEEGEEGGRGGGEKEEGGGEEERAGRFYILLLFLIHAKGINRGDPSGNSDPLGGIKRELSSYL